MSTDRRPTQEATSESLQAEHEFIRDHVEHIRLAALELPSLSPEEREKLISRIVDFLQGELAEHAARAERELYPRVARLLGDSVATASMIQDLDAIRELTARLRETSVNEVSLLQELLYGLHALITIHLRKEEELYLPLLGSERAHAHFVRRNGYGDD